MQRLYLNDNQFSGALPPSLGQLTQLVCLWLQNNQFTQFPSWQRVLNPAALQLEVKQNQVDFSSLEPNFTGPAQQPFQSFFYIPQVTPPGADTVHYAVGQALTLRRSLGGQHTHYQWQQRQAGQWQDVVGAQDSVLTVPTASVADSGAYRVAGTNDWVTNLRLYSKTVYAQVLMACAPLSLNLSPAVSLPAGDAVILCAYPSQAGATVRWSPANGLSATSGLAVTAFPTVTTTYTAQALSADTCASVAVASVTVTVTPPAALSNPPVDGCVPALASATPPAPGPDSVNFVRSYVPRVALTDSAAVRQASQEQVQVQVRTEYLDGLGRPVQTVLRQESPRGNDLVQPVAYDGLGRQVREYLPYVAANPQADAGAYRPDALCEQDDFYRSTPVGPGFATDDIVRTGVAYSEKQLEASPLNRVLAQAAPGEAWQLTPTGGHAVRRQERPNTAADALPRLVPGYAPTPRALAYPGDYAPGELWGVETTDEQGQRTQDFTDKLGQVVARRVEAGAGTWLSTYYAYDDFGHLRAVVPPQAAVLLQQSGGLVTPAVDSLLFRTRYDGRGRPVAKQVPGPSGETLVVYDQLDRPVLSQDAAQRTRKEWSWTKYDALGRVVLSGLVTRADTAGQVSLQALAAADTATAHQVEQRTADGVTYPHFYTTDQAFPRLGQQGFGAGQVLSASYYDDYNFDNDAAGTPDAAYDTSTDAQFPAGQAPVVDAGRCQGLPTRTQTRVLGVAENDPAQAAWLTTTTFYDERARPVQVQITNARKGSDLLTSQLDFTGKVLQSVAVHQGPNHAPVVVAEFFSYDHAGRLLDTRQQVADEAQPVTVARNRYNEIGQLSRHTLAPDHRALRQQVDYRYNARGWLTNLNDADYSAPGSLFNLNLSYDCGFAVPQYNGNVAGQKWRGRDGIERAYGYLYDGANRLSQGDFVARNAGTQAWTAERQRYGLAGLHYDENGNIRALQRRGLLQAASHGQPAQFGAVDQLTYAYAGNRLQAVDDAVSTNQLPRPANYNGAPTSLAGDFQEQGVHLGQEYDYDANGNLTADRNKGITGISYNHLNLPRQIHFGSGADSLVFRYTASGQKVAKLVYQTGKPLVRTDYLGPYQYQQDSLKFFPHAEGRVLRFVSYDAAGQATVRYQREYTLKDQLGNLRLAYRLGQVRTLTATLEQDAPTRKRETQQFDSLSVSPPIAVSTSYARSGTYAAQLNAGGSAPQPLGPLTQLGVQQGDTVMVQAFGLYAQPVQHSFWFSLGSFLAGILHPGQAPPPGLDGRKRSDLPLLQVGVAAGLTSIPQLRGGVPQGYLRLLVFDKDSALVSQQVQQLSQAARGSYESLRLQVVLPQDGYVTAYVGSQSDVDVFFDDVSVEHRPGLQVQETEYNPTGLELAGLAPPSPGIKGLNNYRFNEKEFQVDLGLNWTNLDWRFFDSQLDDLHVVDPEIENGQESISPYVFGYDNAVRYNDPDGRCPCEGLLGSLVSYSNGFVAAVNDNSTLGLVNRRESLGASTSDENSHSFNAGQDAGDRFSAFWGGVEIGAAAAGTFVLGVGEVSSGGAATPAVAVAVPAAVGLAIHGNAVANRAITNFNDRNGRVNAEGTRPARRTADNNHGNKLNDKPSEGYTLRDRDTGQTQKYGKTTRGKTNLVLAGRRDIHKSA